MHITHRLKLCSFCCTAAYLQL